MGKTLRKYLLFDLDTTALKEEFGPKRYTVAYSMIRQFLENCGFEHNHPKTIQRMASKITSFSFHFASKRLRPRRFLSPLNLKSALPWQISSTLFRKAAHIGKKLHGS